MKRSLIEFYATPTEQCCWLTEILSKSFGWTVIMHPNAQSSCRPMDVGDIKNLNFQAQNEDQWMLFFGNQELATLPVWQNLSQGQVLDFGRSFAIQFVPSLTVAPDILLDGRLGILSPSQYDSDQKTYRALVSWFKNVGRLLASSLNSNGTVLVQYTTQGFLKEWKDVLVSRGAVEWRRQGNRLKQFPCGEVDFDVRMGSA